MGERPGRGFHKLLRRFHVHTCGGAGLGSSSSCGHTKPDGRGVSMLRVLRGSPINFAPPSGICSTPARGTAVLRRNDVNTPTHNSTLLNKS